MSAGDILGFVTGLACVWLTARANIWNFPTGILNCIILGLVFFQRGLFADASLQIVFIVLAVIGWRKWLSGGHAGESSPVFSSSPREQAILFGVAAALTLVLWRLLISLQGASPPIDALITALSLCAQWQLNRRQLSTWAWWIAVDLISIPLYWSRGLPLIAVLYTVYLLICLRGWRHWRRLPRADASA
ncbi:MAG: nicotinamide riboside transporter PnuC [Azoarcus sp.]|jgi:nicotinamide mononucleotide transporter|nr:nicotinamide riboside transporter PnuC [Azoarcus sp.]